MRFLKLMYIASALIAGGGAFAQVPKKDVISAYPDHPIRLVVPVPPGGSSDGVARVVAQRLGDSWGQQVIVDNRSGAAEIIGTDIVAKANPDGYTLVLVSLRFSVNPSLLKLPYDPVKDLEPVTMTAAVGNVLVVNSKTPVKSVKDVIALAKQKPSELTFASSGIGGAPHLIGEFVALQTGIKLTHIAYKGGGPAIADVVGGNVFMSFASMTSALPFIKAGRLRPLAVSSKERSAQLPDVPTMGEAGVPNIIVRDWQGVLGPRGMPRPIVDKLNAEIGRIMKHADNQERLTAMGIEVIASTPEEFRAAIASEMQRWGKVVKDANIKME
ncbi:MAG TPA: tripartite tricarboxylate transporter substrate binding protein [Burkholderiales bacterium]|jgi:tripartite-type tricarboxylate transporter receptor subunit TctC|nr:tripartite tricarboxylate transporter substrate binding protein [Burkholderiales bacterium]